MKIFHVINSLGTGGSESMLYEIIKNDKKNSHIIFLISEQGTVYKNFIKLNNCKILDYSDLSLFKKLRKIFKIVKSFKDSKKQITFNTWMYKSHIYIFIVKFFINFQLLLHIRHCGITKEHSLINKIPIYITKYLSKKFANKIIYNSDFSKFNHEKIGFSKNLGIVIQNGYQQSDFKKGDIKINKKQKIAIGMLARKNFIKDHDTLIDTFHELSKKNKNLFLYLQGAGLEKDFQLREKIRKINNKNIIISKTLDKETFFKKIDIHILSSYGESFPNVVVEAIQRNVFSMSSQVGDVKQILPKDFIFQIGNKKELKKKLLRVIFLFKNQPKKIEQIKKNLKKSINKKFQFKNQLSKFSLIWKKHLNTKNALLIVPTLVGGGAERVMTYLCEDLKNNGYITTLIVLGQKDPTQYEINKDINLIYLNKSRSLYSTKEIIKYFFGNYDLAISTIVQCNIICIFAKIISFSRIKLFVRETNTPSEILKYDWSLKNYFSFLVRKAYNFSDFVLCNSNGVKLDLINNVKIRKNKTFILPNSLNTNQILKKSNEKFKDIYSPYFLFAGRLSKQKNVHQMINSFHTFYMNKNNKKYKLLIFGQGSEKNRLIGLIKKFKLERNIIIKSFSTNIFKYIKSSKGVLLSSKWEGMPNILLQSLYLNKPVLSTDCRSGPKELKKFGYSVKLAPVNDTIKYANQLELLSKTKVNFKKNIILNKKYSDIYYKSINKLF